MLTMNKILENKTIVALTFTIAIIFTAIAMSGSSYALYVNKDYGTTEDYTTGLLDLTFDENTTLTLASAFPISDEEGLASDPYILKVTNTGNLTYKFNIELLDTTSNNLIDNKYIKIKVDDGDIYTLNTTNILSKDITLVPGESKSINVRMWLSEDTPNSEAGKGFSAKATTNGYAVYTTGNEVALPANANTYIISQSKGDSWPADLTDSGLYATNKYTADDGTTKYHDYRYIGANVNNYVKFNNDLYRIIGVFDENSHGVTGKYLVKLIMASPLSGNSWGVYNTSNTSGTYSNYKNDWTGKTTSVKANLNVLLNEYFANSTNTSSTYGSCSNWTYFSSNTNYRTNDCSDIVGYGIDSKLTSYIEDATWYLYGSGKAQSKQNWYLCERGGNSCTPSGTNQGDASVTSKMGLMYLSDYLYASGYYASTDTTTQGTYYYGNKNWLYKGWEWTQTPNASGADYVWYVNNGYAFNNNTYTPFGWRPALYLKSNIKISGGFGTYNNPYILEQG